MRLPWQRPTRRDDGGRHARPGRRRAATPHHGHTTDPTDTVGHAGNVDHAGTADHASTVDRAAAPSHAATDDPTVPANHVDPADPASPAGPANTAGPAGGVVPAGGGRAGGGGGLRGAVGPPMMSGASTFGVRERVPAGRAERLGLIEVDPAASTALAMPHEFLRLGDSRRVGGEMAGYIDGLGARVFEFHADEFLPHRSGAVAGAVSEYAGFPYHVAAVELGYRLPWLAIAARRLHAPVQQLYPGRRGQVLRTPDRSANRGHVLHADGPGADGVLDAALLAWLADVLVMRIEHKTLATLEVSHGWALAAVQAHALVRPDADALAMQAHDPRRPGPWPDTLLGLLRNFRDRVPQSQRGS
jgi:hypothetical protein